MLELNATILIIIVNIPLLNLDCQNRQTCETQLYALHQNTLQTYRDRKVKKKTQKNTEKINFAKSNHKKNGAVLLVSAKVDFQTKKITEDKEDYFIHKILKKKYPVFASKNRVSKYMKQNQRELKEEIGNPQSQLEISTSFSPQLTRKTENQEGHSSYQPT